eukprot:gene11762-15739_t
MERSKRIKAKNDVLKDLKDALSNGKSSLDALEFEEEDIYDLKTEEEYAELVNSRRIADSFVVDDNGMGYYDNGEEIVGVGEDAYDSKKRLKEAAKEGDSKMSKKARMLAEASAADGKNSIKRHLLHGVSGLGMNRMIAAKEVTTQNVLDIDALMNSSGGGHESSQSKRTNTHSINMGNRLPPRAPIIIKRPVQNLHAQSYHYSNNNYGEIDDDYTQMDVSVDEQNDHEQTDAKSVRFSSNNNEQFHHPTNFKETENESKVNVSIDKKVESNKMSLTKTTKKLSDRVAAVNAAANASTTFKPASTVDGSFKPELGDNFNNSNGLFQNNVESETDNMAGNGGGSYNNKIDPKQWMQYTQSEAGDDTNDGSFMNMYWTDAAENNGLVYLFGKIAVNEENGSKRFVSCCVVVHGCQRNLFVLPRVIKDEFKDDGTPCRIGISDVYGEINKLLVPDVVPRSQGQSFKCKLVKRKYAFEDTNAPREETEYLKIVYSAKHGIPNPNSCQNGGKTFERIFGVSSGPLELFLLKRKLMGPCWIKIKNPKLNPDQISWCKIEVAIEDPKLVSKLENPMPAPMLVSMCISIKTAVNPVSHLHEIVAISGLTHTKVDSEADTELNHQFMRRFVFVRKLGLTSGPTYPAQFPHDLKAEIKRTNSTVIQSLDNERALLSLFFSKVQQEDPDIFASHNLLGFEFDVLLSRAVINKLSNWSLLGRLKRTKPPKSINDKDAIPGRILCDTYKAAKEFLRETTYSLTHLAQSQLGFDRVEVEPIDVPRYFSNSMDIIKICHHTLHDAMLVQKLMLKLQVVPLTKQLTNLSGNLWSRTIRGARAERIEYLLLHEFHALKYILPEKKAFENKKGAKVHALDDGDNDDGENKVGGTSRTRAKAAYAGGLVLEPKKGLYDTFILLLDFNSLYPSIIQEYNLCFTTIDWTKFMGDQASANDANKKVPGSAKQTKTDDIDGDDHEQSGDESDGEDGIANSSNNKSLPPLPDTRLNQGILPRVIKTLVDRRKQVKSLLKKEKDNIKRQELDIRQKALKLTANSMYGCLGFTFSRFYARPIAALVTAMGREALQRTVDLSTNALKLDVIYGDTDSVMINTNSTDLTSVKELGNLVKKEVNKLYKSLELDLDGIFKSMLLLKKKKYAAVVIKEESDGTISYEKELKGLDLVRRDWCPLSKDAGKYVVDQILSGKPREEIVLSIHDYLADLSQKIRSGSVELHQFVVTKGLNKSPKDYPDCKGQAHLQVALQMLKANKPGSHAPQRAHHPDELLRGNGELTLDFEWYLSNQILPPISRLCEPIEGTSSAIISEKLGLDASKYARSSAHNEDFLDDQWGFTPKCMMDDSERFKDCFKLKVTCSSCKQENEVRSIMDINSANKSGLCCTNCGSLYYGLRNARDCYCYISNRITLLVRDCQKKYYDCWLRCDEHSCSNRTMQQPIKGNLRCSADCHGRMTQEYDESMLHTQLKYIESLFDVHRYQTKYKISNENGLFLMMSKDQIEVFHLLHKHLSNTIRNSSYNWIRPSIWTAVQGKRIGLMVLWSEDGME